MPDTFTANYNFTKPEVGASRDVWGGKWNANADSLDAILTALNAGKLSRAGGEVTGLVNFAPASPPTLGGPGVGKELATKEWVVAKINALLGVGVIAKWSGTIATIPAGWSLCDGTNGTPDMRNKFVMGAGSDANAGGFVAPGSTGGANTHNHGGATAGHALTADQHAPHNHTLSDPGHSHNVYDPGHSHTYNRYSSASDQSAVGGSGQNYLRSISTTNDQTSSNSTNISIYGAGTNITIASQGSGNAHTHGISTIDHRPPYYALAFIMRTAPVTVA